MGPNDLKIDIILDGTNYRSWSTSVTALVAMKGYSVCLEKDLPEAMDDATEKIIERMKESWKIPGVEYSKEEKTQLRDDTMKYMKTAEGARKINDEIAKNTEKLRE